MNRTRNPTAGQIWRKSDHERITITDVDGDTVGGTLSEKEPELLLSGWGAL